MTWVVTPKKTGTFEIVVGFNSLIGEKLVQQSRVIGISVTDILGLTPLQARLLSSAGTFLGPILTAPWWYERLKNLKSKKKKNENLEKKRKKETNKTRLAYGTSGEITAQFLMLIWLALLVVMVLLTGLIEKILGLVLTFLPNNLYGSPGAVPVFIILLLFDLIAVYFFIQAWIKFLTLGNNIVRADSLIVGDFERKLIIEFVRCVSLFILLFIAQYFWNFAYNVVNQIMLLLFLR